VFFVPQPGISHAVADEMLPVKGVDRPCLVVAQAARDGKLDLSVADPDLNLEDKVSRPQPLRLTLRGKWRLLEAKATVCVWPLPDAKQQVRLLSANAEETTVQILCQHGTSYDLKLAR
jgi:hypothetical protein